MNFYNREMVIRAASDPVYDRGVQLYFWVRETTANGVTVSVAKEIVFEKITPENEGMVSPPTIQFRMEAAQILMDELWKVGLRPTEGTGSAGSLAATQRHLEDMRTLVFKKNGGQPPSSA